MSNKLANIHSVRVACAVIWCLLLFAFASPVRADEKKELTEKQKIEALIKHIEEMKDAKFVRNDSEYDAKTAARFLRGKWEANDRKVKTAQDFIEKIASISSTTEKPYLIRLKDGKEIKTSEYLPTVLKKLQAPADRSAP